MKYTSEVQETRFMRERERERNPFHERERESVCVYTSLVTLYHLLVCLFLLTSSTCMYSSGMVLKGDRLYVFNIPEVFSNGLFVLLNTCSNMEKEIALNFNVKTFTSNAASNKIQHDFSATEGC
jgi:hypothetical protein